jgi:hypothetical protein
MVLVLLDGLRQPQRARYRADDRLSFVFAAAIA